MALIEARIGRASLSLSDLVMGEGTLYRLPDRWLNAGVSEYRRRTPTPDGNVPGRQLTDYVLDVVTPTITTLIGDNGTSVADIKSAFSTLIDAVRQPPGWTFQVSYSGTVVAKWKCEPAAIAPDFGKLLLSGFLPVTLTVPRNPIPVTGPF